MLHTFYHNKKINTFVKKIIINWRKKDGCVTTEAENSSQNHITHKNRANTTNPGKAT